MSSETVPSETAALFLECGEVVRSVFDEPELAARWSEPSALAEMTIGSLAAHTARGVSTVAQYIESPAEPVHPVETAVEYFHAALALSDYGEGLDSEIQRGIRARSEEEADAGAAAVAAALSAALTGLAGALEEPPERLTVARGLSMPVDPYLETRIIEMVIHLDDLDHSLKATVHACPDAATSLVAAKVFELSKMHHGSMPLIRALSRPERAGDISGF